MRRFALIFVCGSLAAVWGQRLAVDVGNDLKHDVSPPLRTLPPAVDKRPHHVKDIEKTHSAPLSNSPDTAIQSSAPKLINTAAGLNLLGIGVGFSGPAGAFTVGAAPPDINGAVGATQYVQWVNESFAVFDKNSGAVIYGPAGGNTLWTGFGGGCETNNDGDPIVQYDKAANRWVMSQFSVSTTPYLQCVAVSTTSDAAGSYYRYSFQMPNFPDYPKLGVWPDAYYISLNMFSGNNFAGARACALDRGKMLAGAGATQQCAQLSTAYGGLLPSDLDGNTPPPAGSPDYYMAFGRNSLQLWKFHVDWTNSANSSFTGPTILSVASFAEACGGGNCIPQSGTTQLLDSLGDRLMFRLAYRNFGDHESLVATHSVTAGSSVGTRWYEIRSPGGAPVVYQQSTYAPDSSYRWMGSIAMDRAGDMALGYSVSSAGMFPAIRYTGRLPGDSLNTMGAENSIVEGTGSQSKNLERWGDYTSMAIDPVDDCTFWYTNEYLQSSGAFNWATRIASFRFPSCVPLPPTVYIDSPAANAAVSGTINIWGWAIDNSAAVGTAISSVQVNVDGVAVGNATYGQSRPDVCNVFPGRVGCPNVGYSYLLNTGTLSAGAHTITIVATDTDLVPDSGASSVTVNVATPPPFVFIDSPAPNSPVSGTINLWGWAIDNVSSVGTAISSVQVKVDGNVVGNASYGGSRPDVCAAFPGRPGCPNVGYNYQLDTSTLSLGTHVITVVATDSDAVPQSGLASVSVTIASPPPSVYIDRPASGETISGTYLIEGWAIDNMFSVGTAISSVQVKVDGAVVGNATYGSSRPDVCAVFPGRPGCPNVGYSFQLNTGTLAAGSHTITVTATDSDATPQSSSSSVTVAK